jgi:hypothetical protein
LLEAYQEVVRTAKERQSAQEVPEPAPSRRPFFTFMLAMAAVLALLLIWQPGWLFTKPPAESREMKVASLRVRMYSEIQHIDQFRASHGRLPTTLPEAGGDSTGVVYSRGEDHYTLTGTNQDVTLTYSSDTPPKNFLANSYDVIRGRTAR